MPPLFPPLLVWIIIVLKYKKTPMVKCDINEQIKQRRDFSWRLLLWKVSPPEVLFLVAVEWSSAVLGTTACFDTSNGAVCSLLLLLTTPRYFLLHPRRLPLSVSAVRRPCGVVCRMAVSTSQQVALAFTAVLFTFVVLPRMFGVGGGTAAKDTRFDSRYSRKGEKERYTVPPCSLVSVSSAVGCTDLVPPEQKSH